MGINRNSTKPTQTPHTQRPTWSKVLKFGIMSAGWQHWALIRSNGTAISRGPNNFAGQLTFPALPVLAGELSAEYTQVSGRDAGRQAGWQGGRLDRQAGRLAGSAAGSMQVGGQAGRQAGRRAGRQVALYPGVLREMAHSTSSQRWHGVCRWR